MTCCASCCFCLPLGIQKKKSVNNFPFTGFPRVVNIIPKQDDSPPVPSLPLTQCLPSHTVVCLGCPVWWLASGSCPLLPLAFLLWWTDLQVSYQKAPRDPCVAQCTWPCQHFLLTRLCKTYLSSFASHEHSTKWINDTTCRVWNCFSLVTLLGKAQTIRLSKGTSLRVHLQGSTRGLSFWVKKIRL